MHCPLRDADVDRAQAQVRRSHRPNRRSATHVAAHHEVLVRHSESDTIAILRVLVTVLASTGVNHSPCRVTHRFEQRRRHVVRRIPLVLVRLDDHTLVQNRLVLRLMLAHVVRVQCVRAVGGKHDRSRHHAGPGAVDDDLV